MKTRTTEVEALRKRLQDLEEMSAQSRFTFDRAEPIIDMLMRAKHPRPSRPRTLSMVPSPRSDLTRMVHLRGSPISRANSLGLIARIVED